MTQMSAAVLAMNLDSAHAVAVVDFRLDIAVRHRRGKARPAGAGVELRGAVEQRLAAANAAVEAILMIVPVRASERALSTLFTGYVVLLGRELFLPVFVGLPNLLRHGL